MIRHVGTEHFGKRSYCTICFAAMKQDSNMSTHLNVHLSNSCTICSCGQGFTDPSAYTRHREAHGHEKGVTHGKVRPAIIKGIKVQHVAGLTINLDLISDPTFVPPAFDTSYHLKGKPKPKAQEKYNPIHYVELTDEPLVPVTQAIGTSLTSSAPATEYEESEPSPMQSEIKVDELGIDADYSYDVVLPQEFQCNQVPETDEHIECHSSLALPPTEYSHMPPHTHPSEQEAALYHAEACVPTETTHYHQNSNFYLPQYQEAIVPNTNNYFSPPQHPFAEPQVQPEYQTIPPQGFCLDRWSMPAPSFYTSPPQQTYRVKAGFGVDVHEQFRQPQFQPTYQYNTNPYDQALYPEIAGY